MPALEPLSTYQFRIAPSFRVDRSSSTLHDLAIMTGGREAAGHGIYIDQQTIQSGYDVITASGGQLRAAIRHPSLMDQLSGKTDRVLDMPGYFSDIRIDGNKLVAGKFEFFDTFREQNPEAVSMLMEMAEKTPRLFGLSAEPSGRLVYVDTLGHEYPAAMGSDAPSGVALANGGLPTLRITSMGVAAFVDQPAANDGIFAKLSACFGPRLDLAQIKTLATAFLKWAEGEATLHARANTEDHRTDSPMNIISAIKAEFGADKAAFSRAMLILGEKSDITIEALKAEMVQHDLAAARQHLATFEADLTTAKQSIATLTAERDEWKAKFESIKNSGHSTEIDLGAASTTVGDNPWAPETQNYTRQAHLLKENPTLAAALKAAAGIK